MRSQVTAQVNVAQAKMLRQDRRGNFFERFWRQKSRESATGSVRQTARNRLKIGAHREGTVSDDILET
tara:strand:- start:578 stop:781 length:204 start_codon:yes stop_codon:yes gene_type:complete